MCGKLTTVGVNAIRVYNLDPNINHDLCASIFNAVGIYLLLDVNSPFSGESINRGAPWESYYAGYLNRTFGVVEAFHKFPNTRMKSFPILNSQVSKEARGCEICCKRVLGVETPVALPPPPPTIQRNANLS